MNINRHGSSGSEDQRQDTWEATFFKPDGTSITQTGAAANPAAEDASAPDQADIDPAVAVQEHMDDLGEALHDKFIGLLTSKVLETGGQLTIDDVAEMGEAFRTQMKEIETIFLDAVESYTLAREKIRVDQSRGNFFTRLMVRKFEHRFADEETLQRQPELLSRRMLPGYIDMIQVMFGDARVAGYEARAKALIDKMREDAGGGVSIGTTSIDHRKPENSPCWPKWISPGVSMTSKSASTG